jgi:hypothetical protein
LLPLPTIVVVVVDDEIVIMPPRSFATIIRSSIATDLDELSAVFCFLFVSSESDDDDDDDEIDDDRSIQFLRFESL